MLLRQQQRRRSVVLAQCHRHHHHQQQQHLQQLREAWDVGHLCILLLPYVYLKLGSCPGQGSASCVVKCFASFSHAHIRTHTQRVGWHSSFWSMFHSAPDLSAPSGQWRLAMTILQPSSMAAPSPKGTTITPPPAACSPTRLAHTEWCTPTAINTAASLSFRKVLATSLLLVLLASTLAAIVLTMFWTPQVISLRLPQRREGNKIKVLLEFRESEVQDMQTSRFRPAQRCTNHPLIDRPPASTLRWRQHYLMQGN